MIKSEQVQFGARVLFQLALYQKLSFVELYISPMEDCCVPVISLPLSWKSCRGARCYHLSEHDWL
jgi:hypothetical protein